MSHTQFAQITPLADITKQRLALANKNVNVQQPTFQKPSATIMPLCQQQQILPTPAVLTPYPSSSAALPAATRKQHNPYAAKVLPKDEAHAALIIRQWEEQGAAAAKARAQHRAIAAAVAAHQQAQALRQAQLLQEQQQQQQEAAPSAPSAAPTTASTTMSTGTPSDITAAAAQAAAAPVQAPVCRCLVQFKCHHGEYASPVPLMKGQYVVVQGDRGIDIGIVIRINTEDAKSYVERTGPAGRIVRHATQREVDYWSTDLKADEQAALEYVQQRVQKHRLPMEVKHAEYQFDKKKLTFYYESKTRVDFVALLKDLFREFSCRIWMEKVRTHDTA